MSLGQHGKRCAYCTYTDGPKAIHLYLLGKPANEFSYSVLLNQNNGYQT